MSKIKATDGKEFEIVDDHAFGRYVLEPVKQEPKFKVAIDNPETIVLVFDTPIPFGQAQLIKEAVEALMEYVMGEKLPGEWTDAVDKARQAMRENN